MYAVETNQLIHTGRVGDIFAVIKNKLASSHYQQGLQDAAPGFLYYYFLSPFFQQYRSSLPVTVQQKVNAAKSAYDYIHDHWGFQYSQMNNPNRTGIIDQTLTKLLGMVPDQYLGLALGLDKSQVKITGLFDTLTNLVSKGTTTAAAVPSPIQPVAAGVTTATKVVSSVLSKIIQLNPPDTWQQAFPQVSDWQGWTKAPIGRYAPSVNDPLGLTGYNGSTFGAAQPSSAAVPTIAVQQQSATQALEQQQQLQTGATQASAGGSNKWVTIIFVGSLLGLLGWNFLRHNQ